VPVGRPAVAVAVAVAAAVVAVVAMLETPCCDSPASKQHAT
jgi:hypothetical protein